MLINASKTENTLKTLKMPKCFPYTKKMVEKKKVTTDLLVFCQMFQVFTKSVCMIRSMVLLKINFQYIKMQISLGLQYPKCTPFYGRKDAISQ